MTELAKIDKPEARQFNGKRKLYVVPLLFNWQDSPPDYGERLEQYWRQVREHIANLESRAGTVNVVFHESVTEGGDDGLKILERLNSSSYQVAREKYLMGARFEAIEDKELIEEAMDWERHLILGFISRKVGAVVSQLFSEASKKRFEHLTETIASGLKEGEAGLLIISEAHQVRFPSDVEVFLVAPPALNEVHRWLRERQEQEERQQSQGEVEEPAKPTPLEDP